jgi:glucosamine--fructose-6-phosphate aminotransferase (isomerizing)
MTGNVVVVHNGIVENFLELRSELAAEEVVFNSDTDTEVIVHLVERYLSAEAGLVEAARKAIGHLKGAHGIVLMSAAEPDKIVAARVGNAGGVVIGLGKVRCSSPQTCQRSSSTPAGWCSWTLARWPW